MRTLAALLLAMMLTALCAALGPAAASAGTAQGRVALVGVPGLVWSDIDQSRTPNLWKLVTQGGSASMSTRTVPPQGRGITCPVTGWLTVSAGQRAGTPGKGCQATPTPQPNGEGATIPGWRDLVTHQSTTGYAAQLGTLAQTITDSGGTVAAIGPGAALAAADKSGNIAKYADTPESLGDPTRYTLIVMEAPDLANAWADQPPDEYGIPASMPSTTRQAAAAAADRRIGTLLTTLPADTTILVAGVSDVTPGAHLHVAIATGPPYSHGHLTATSTRQDALVTLADLTATTIELAGAEPAPQVVGRPWQSAATPPPATVADSVTELADADLASQVLVTVRGPFFAIFVAVQLLFYAFAALALRRRRASSTPARPSPSTPDRPQPALPASTSPASPTTTAAPTQDSLQEDPQSPAPATPPSPKPNSPTDPTTSGTSPARATDPPAISANGNGVEHRTQPLSGGSGGSDRLPRAGFEVASASRLLVAVQVVSVVSGSIAVSTFLAQLVPWWSLPAPMTALIVTILAIAGLITALAFAGPWRTHVLGPLTVVAAVTSVAMLVDVMTGSTLQVNAVSGYEPVTGGRFYGFSNIAFAIYATGTILGLAGVAQWLMGRGASRFVTMLVCVLYGGLAVFADGWPSWGADFGGVPAFVVGLAVFLILLSGRRVSVLKLLLVGLAGGALISAIALFDWLRPATQRTHLGTFVQQVIDGQALTVVVRKFTAMVGVTVGNWSLTLLSLVALAFLFLVLNRPSRWGASALGQTYALAPALRAGLIGALTSAFIGFLMNDSGIAIPSMALTVAVPLTLAACVRALQLAKSTPLAPPSAQEAPTERTHPVRRS
ncbi:hypothetical protein [Nonomuraea glycinis]|uniref:MFS transporter n=1 Tax=Nonomuraea glycinis TaxID=2047744 RepID=A0A918A1S8_9ACTN|nr:hypothetical protein [Nonomuraea glycinis]GGP02777.1 hypothetical protein GCM10012278_11350 [Nonomuraea glycinis]